jgi:SAM-dependent methyltransferase
MKMHSTRERADMSTHVIQRSYNDVVAPHYDLDPQALIGRSLARALAQLRKEGLLRECGERLRVLDLGMGTGLFLEKLTALGGDIQPFGLDLAERMVETARRRIPDLVAEVDDAVNLDDRFVGQSFDLICTHFMTGFVPMKVLAPKIRSRLVPGGHWSLVGGTRAGFPALQAKTHTRLVRWLSGAGSRTLDDVLLNPADVDEVAAIMEANGFEMCVAETFEPVVDFRNFDDFMEFGYRGGWFTPIIEALGVHKAGAITRWLANRVIFPLTDHHSIAIVLARKVAKQQ